VALAIAGLSGCGSGAPATSTATFVRNKLQIAVPKDNPAKVDELKDLADGPEADKAINDYPIATLAKAPAGDLARQFVDLVLSQQGKDALARAGFEAP
jgi:ABC-type Fe3+ transport system substrate-binding protein